MCLKGGEMDSNNNQHKTKKMFFHLLHKIQQGNKENLIDATLLTTLKVNGLVKH
jgi:hypothetical protein